MARQTGERAAEVLMPTRTPGPLERELRDLDSGSGGGETPRGTRRSERLPRGEGAVRAVHDKSGGFIGYKVLLPRGLSVAKNGTKNPKAYQEPIGCLFGSFEDARETLRLAVAERRQSLYVIRKLALLGELVPKEAPGVYVIQGDRDMVKIGASGNVLKRIRQLQISCPDRLRLIAILSTDPSDEHRFHARFCRGRKSGEWFKVDSLLLKAIIESRESG